MVYEIMDELFGQSISMKLGRFDIKLSMQSDSHLRWT